MLKGPVTPDELRLETGSGRRGRTRHRPKLSIKAYASRDPVAERFEGRHDCRESLLFRDLSSSGLGRAGNPQESVGDRVRPATARMGPKRFEGRNTMCRDRSPTLP